MKRSWVERMFYRFAHWLHEFVTVELLFGIITFLVAFIVWFGGH